MPTIEQQWWDVIHEILVDQWGFDSSTLKPSTSLFTDDVAAWMDWTELAQTVCEDKGIPWPIPIPSQILSNGWDLACYLAQLHLHPGTTRRQGA